MQQPTVLSHGTVPALGISRFGNILGWYRVLLEEEKVL